MRIQKRRRREYKTDYLKRLKLLKSGKPRIVFRRTNRYIITQYIESEEAKDKIVFGLDSKKLIDYGWSKDAKGSLKSISAAYLTGFLMGKKILKRKLKEPILDVGMTRTLYKKRVFAFIKGLIDSGIKIKCLEDAFPEKERIYGEHLKNKINVEKIKEKIDNE